MRTVDDRARPDNGQSLERARRKAGPSGQTRAVRHRRGAHLFIWCGDAFICCGDAFIWCGYASRTFFATATPIATHTSRMRSFFTMGQPFRSPSAAQSVPECGQTAKRSRAPVSADG